MRKSIKRACYLSKDEGLLLLVEDQNVFGCFDRAFIKIGELDSSVGSVAIIEHHHTIILMDGRQGYTYTKHSFTSDSLYKLPSLEALESYIVPIDVG